MTVAHPKHVSEISPEWLTYALRDGGVLQDASVISVRSKILGEGIGFLSSVARIELEYDAAETGAPSSVVVKIEPDAETFRRIADEMHAFEREIRFYRHVAGRVPIRLPRVYFSLVDPPDYAIVMEDLSFCTPGDQLVGMHEDQVLATARITGRLQAKYWNNAALDSLSWMPLTNGETEGFDQYWPSFVEHFGEMLSREAIEAGERVGQAIPWLEAEEAKRPHTLVHSDLRADNLLFGPPDSDDAVLIVDWQLTVRRLGAYDIARLMGGSEPPAERRGHQMEVIRGWYDTLISEGVTDYAWEDAVRDFKIGTLFCLCIPVKYHAPVLEQGGRGKPLIEVIARRMFASVLELDATSVLP